MARLPEYPEELFPAMQRIRETALVRFDSLFSPEKKLWDLQHLRQFHDLFVGRWIQAKALFLKN